MSFSLPVIPFAALLRRELRTTLRGWLAALSMVVVLGLLMLHVYTDFPADTMALARGAQYSEELIMLLCFGLTACSFLFISPMAALSIAGERERDTFTMLHLTLISPRGLVLGKFLNAAGYFFLLSTGMLPIIGVVFFFVGVDFAQLASSYLLVLSFACFCCAIGLACSARAQRGTVAVVQTFVMVLLLQGVLNGWAYFLFYAGVAGEWIEPFLDAIYPGPFVTLVEHQRAPGLAFLIWSLAHLLFAVIALMFAMRHVTRFRNPRRKVEAKPVDDMAVLEARRNTFPYYLVDPLKRKPPILDGINPMLVREVRWGFLGRATRMIRMLYACVIAQMLLCVLLMSWFPNWPDPIGIGMSVNIVLLLLVSPVLSAGALAREVELGNMDLLRTTLLQPREILHGKMLSAVIGLGPIIFGCLLSSLAYLLGAIIAGQGFFHIFGGFATMCLYLAMGIIVGVFASTIVKSTARALILSYALLLLFTMGVPFGTAMLLAYLNEREEALVVGTSNIVSYFATLETHNYADRFVPSWCISLLLWSLFTWFLYLCTGAFFTLRRMRDV